jgi:hypothetical protein
MALRPMRTCWQGPRACWSGGVTTACDVSLGEGGASG